MESKANNVIIYNNKIKSTYLRMPDGSKRLTESQQTSYLSRVPINSYCYVIQHLHFLNASSALNSSAYGAPNELDSGTQLGKTHSHPMTFLKGCLRQLCRGRVCCMEFQKVSGGGKIISWPPTGNVQAK